MTKDRTQIEADILRALLDFIPRNQNQIADIIKKDHKKSTHRVNVSRALKNLEPFLKRVPNELDEQGKKRVMRQDIETIKQIGERYDSLISDLHENEKIMTILANNFYKDLPKSKEYNDEIKIFSYYLRGSPAFFTLVLFNTPESLKDRFQKVYANTPDGIYLSIKEESRETYFKKMGIDKDKQKFPGDAMTIGDRIMLKTLKDFDDSIFESCVQADILAGIYNQSAIDYIHKKNEASVRHREQWIESLKKNYYELGRNNPTQPYIQFDTTFGVAEDNTEGDEIGT
jgi:hypothetical protein